MLSKELIGPYHLAVDALLRAMRAWNEASRYHLMHPTKASNDAAFEAFEDMEYARQEVRKYAPAVELALAEITESEAYLMFGSAKWSDIIKWTDAHRNSVHCECGAYMGTEENYAEVCPECGLYADGCPKCDGDMLPVEGSANLHQCEACGHQEFVFTDATEDLLNEDLSK